MHRFAAQPLPLWETVVYLTVWPGMLLYIIYLVYTASQEPPAGPYHYSPDFLKVEGWSIFGGRKQDVSDYEWHLWSRVWGKSILAWVAGYTLISCLIRRTGLVQRRWLYQLPMSLVCCWQLLGGRTVLLLLLRATYMYVTALAGRAWLVWLNCLLLLTTLNSDLLVNYLKSFHNEPLEDAVVPQPAYNLLLMVLALYDTRLVSFCLEKCRQNGENQTVQSQKMSKSEETFSEHSKHDLRARAKVHQSKSEAEWSRTVVGRERSAGFGFVDLLNYAHYLPVFYSGPLLTYHKFRNQICLPPSPLTVRSLVGSGRCLARLVFWYLLIEGATHFLHINSVLVTTPSPLPGMDNWALGGFTYLQVYFFLVKYVLIYGVPGWLASLDGVTAPDGPVCIELLYSVSQVWRTFDRGYYSFIVRYIYRPLGGSRRGLVTQICAVWLTFTFVYLWHGTDTRILVWAGYNVLMMTYERVGEAWVRNSALEQFIERHLSASWQRRLAAVAGIPASLMTIHSMFVFIAGPSIGLLLLRRFLLEYAMSGMLPVFLAVVYLRNNCCFHLHRMFYVPREHKAKPD